MRNYVLIVVAAVLLVSCATSDKGRRDARRREKAAWVADAVDRRDYRISIITAYPMRGASVHVAGDFVLAVRGDSVFSYLPYFGRGFTLPYGGGKGLNFKDRMTGYEAERVKDDCVRINFGVKNDEDAYRFTIDVFDNGQVSVDVQPQQRSRISYSGELY